jgi:hypothetical protein
VQERRSSEKREQLGNGEELLPPGDPFERTSTTVIFHPGNHLLCISVHNLALKPYPFRVRLAGLATASA